MRWREIVGFMAVEGTEPSGKAKRRDRRQDRELLLGSRQPSMAPMAGKAMITVARTITSIPPPPMGRSRRDLPAECPLADRASGGPPSADAIIGRDAERSGTSGS